MTQSQQEATAAALYEQHIKFEQRRSRSRGTEKGLAGGQA